MKHLDDLEKLKTTKTEICLWPNKHGLLVVLMSACKMSYHDQSLAIFI